MHEVKMRVPQLGEGQVDKLSVLDFGAGIGSGLWAAIHTYG